MRKSRKLISMPIVSLEEGIQIGSVRSLVVDPAEMAVAAIVIDQRGWFREQKIIPFTKVKSVGNDAITIDQSSNVKKTISLPEMLKLIKIKADPVGTKVIMERGTVLGIVDEYYIDEISGKINDLEISGKLLESLFKGKALLSTEHVRTMGSDVIVVSNDSESYLQKIDGGLQETIHNLKEGTSSLWESTKQKTIEISKNIKDKYEKKEKEPAPDLDIVGEVEIKKEDILPEITDEEKPEQSPETCEESSKTVEESADGEASPDKEEVLIK